jgi:hypothetical protein
MNSIAAYCIAHPGDGYEPLFLGATVLLAFWLILLWMYRRKLFLRI